MANMDVSQSFTAQLFIDNQPVAVSRKVIEKMLEEPDISEQRASVLKNQLIHSANLLSYAEDVTPETFHFAHHDGVYTLRVQGENGQFMNTASMEGPSRNLTVYDGEDPTFFRIIIKGESVKLDDMPDDIHTVALHSGPQHQRWVHTYGGGTYFPVLTDDQDRGGRVAVLELRIIQRNIAAAS